MSEDLEIPDNWAVERLGNVIEFEYGKGLIKASRNENGEYDVYGSNGIVGKHTNYLIKDPCVIIGRKGAAGEVHIATKPCWPIDTTYFVRGSKLFNLNYLYYQLKNLRLVTLEKSTAIPGLNRNDAYRKRISIPPLREQHRIVSKIEELFSELDKGVEALRTAHQQLKVYRQAVLNSAIAGDTSKTIEEVVVSLDQGWSPKCYNEPSGNHQEWGVIKTTAIQTGYFQEMENKRLPENLQPRTQHELKKGDLLITRAGPRVRVGICCLVKKVRPHLLNCDKVYRIRTNTKIAIPEYIAILLNSPKYSREIEKMKTGISDSGVNLTQKGLLKIVISLPSIEQQTKIVQEIETRLSVADKLEETITQSLQQAEALRQSILKRAFEGKLVPQDPNDEPASKLLERIKAEKAALAPVVKKSKINRT